MTRIGIIGAGNMGSAFARRLSTAGHDVTIAAKHPAHARDVAADTGDHVRAVPANEIARDADLLIVATPYGAAVDALRAAGDTAGLTVVDITLPLTPDMSGLTVGHSTSAGEEIQRAVPGAKVVKAFTTIFAQVLGASGDASTVQVFFAGDDAEAKQRVRDLIALLGFDPVDAGPLANARYLEPLGMLNVYFGYVAGRGTRIAPAIVPAS